MAAFGKRQRALSAELRFRGIGFRGGSPGAGHR
jgi:hypothetical protein